MDNGCTNGYSLWLLTKTANRLCPRALTINSQPFSLWLGNNIIFWFLIKKKTLHNRFPYFSLYQLNIFFILSFFFFFLFPTFCNQLFLLPLALSSSLSHSHSQSLSNSLCSLTSSSASAMAIPDLFSSSDDFFDFTFHTDFFQFQANP